jgi:hypothetical protein
VPDLVCGLCFEHVSTAKILSRSDKTNTGGGRPHRSTDRDAPPSPAQPNPTQRVVLSPLLSSPLLCALLAVRLSPAQHDYKRPQPQSASLSLRAPQIHPTQTQSDRSRKTLAPSPPSRLHTVLSVPRPRAADRGAVHRPPGDRNSCLSFPPLCAAGGDGGRRG